jgi:hypothetical protein
MDETRESLLGGNSSEEVISINRSDIDCDLDKPDKTLREKLSEKAQNQFEQIKKTIAPYTKRAIKRLKIPKELLKNTWPIPGAIAASTAIIAAPHRIVPMIPALFGIAAGTFALYKASVYEGPENIKRATTVLGALTTVSSIIAIPIIAALHSS